MIWGIAFGGVCVAIVIAWELIDRLLRKRPACEHQLPKATVVPPRE